MNKKLLSMAVAAAMVAPTAAMAEAVLYGKLHMSIDWADVENGFEGWGLNGRAAIPGEGRANRIGVKGSEDLGNGMQAIYQVEFGIKMTEESTTGNAASGSNDSISMRNSFVGLTGGWGTFVVGRNDTPFKTSTGKLDLFSDTMADYNGTVGFDDVRADNAIAYVSPSLAGFQLAAAVHAGGASTAGYGENLNSDSLAEAYSIAGIYSNGPFYASLAYESLGSELYMNTAASDNKFSPNYVDDDYTKWRLGLGLMDWNGFTLTGIYEEQSNLPKGQINPAANNEKLKIWQVQAGYSFGNNMVKAMYGSGNRDGRINVGAPKDIKDTVEGDYYTWAIAFDHNLSKRTKAYVLYTQVDDDKANTDWDGFSVGMIHNF
ncbi:porin [Allochromatium tepidum]|uniref:Porin n=1 Tax=Allochromatium tepidum TaxID=553982 RepID=A0ABN6GGA2_9GAMM|nr:porin [Allochromatium tepidum]BCU08184.1 porin [Allochromatium tepidum]